MIYWICGIVLILFLAGLGWWCYVGWMVLKRIGKYDRKLMQRLIKLMGIVLVRSPSIKRLTTKESSGLKVGGDW